MAQLEIMPVKLPEKAVTAPTYCVTCPIEYIPDKARRPINRYVNPLTMAFAAAVTPPVSQVIRFMVVQYVSGFKNLDIIGCCL